jgi:hypothetical protein
MKSLIQSILKHTARLESLFIEDCGITGKDLFTLGPLL